MEMQPSWKGIWQKSIKLHRYFSLSSYPNFSQKIHSKECEIKHQRTLCEILSVTETKTQYNNCTHLESPALGY